MDVRARERRSLRSAKRKKLQHKPQFAKTNLFARQAGRQTWLNFSNAKTLFASVENAVSEIKERE